MQASSHSSAAVEIETVVFLRVRAYFLSLNFLVTFISLKRVCQVQ